MRYGDASDQHYNRIGVQHIYNALQQSETESDYR